MAEKFNPPLPLKISFLMDNMTITLENNILTIINDPIYYPFENSIEQVKSDNIVRIEVEETL